MASAIETVNLKKIYRRAGIKGKEVQALADLNLKVEEGEIYGFIGPNGAGKTTTIKILIGLLAPSSGKAFIVGNFAGSQEAKAKLGFLPEVTCYYTFMEAFELLDFYASLYGMSKVDRRKKIEEALKLVGLYEKRYTRLREFSKGMLQRFGIAQAIINDPPILILDEPTSGLDPIAQKEIKDIVMELKSRHITIFFSSHFLWEVEDLCDRIGIINKGVMIKSGPLADFKAMEAEKAVDVIFASSRTGEEELKKKGFELRKFENGKLLVQCAPERVNEVVDAIRSGKADIFAVEPRKETLEDVFFRLVTAEGKKL